MPDENLKQQLETTTKEIRALKRMLLSCDAKGVRATLEQTEEAIRPMLWALRTEEERQQQRELDSYCW